MIIELGDKVKLKKKHPCGGNEWQVVRVGADYKIKCLTCGQEVMLDADKLKKAVKAVKNADGDNRI